MYAHLHDDVAGILERGIVGDADDLKAVLGRQVLQMLRTFIMTRKTS